MLLPCQYLLSEQPSILAVGVAPVGVPFPFHIFWPVVLVQLLSSGSVSSHPSILCSVRLGLGLGLCPPHFPFAGAA